MTWLGLSEPAIRLTVSALMLLVMGLWEAGLPWRHMFLGRSRWPGNFGILAVDILVVRLVAPFSLVVLADRLAADGIGLLPALGLPVWAAGVIGFLLLDLIIYWQHRIFHQVPWLWRLHRMHHADTELDASSGLRFHPIEILLSLAIKAAAIAILGVPPTAVLIFEIVLNASSIFNHGNVKLPGWLEPALRRIIVTPEMHIIHHSTERTETDANYGFNLSLWDRLFGSYVDRPAKGYDGMTVGLDEFRDPREQRLDRLLTQPFREP